MLRARSIGKDYGPVTAVRDVSLDVPSGTTVGLVGNNGAGKTTTLKMLAGLVAPTRGTIEAPGGAPTTPRVRQAIGFLPEDSPLYDDQTPVQYLRFFGGLYGMDRRRLRGRIPEVLRLLRLDPPYWDRPIGQLSKGSQRKVAVARALLHDPDVLLLDEPASGLDPATRAELDALLVSLRGQGKAILLSAHDLGQIEALCDHILLVDDGRVVEEGSLDALRQRWGGTTYHVTATTAFPGSRPEGAVHVADLCDPDAAQAAMDEVRDAGGLVLHVASRPPGLDHILAQAAGR